MGAGVLGWVFKDRDTMEILYAVVCLGLGQGVVWLSGYSERVNAPGRAGSKGRQELLKGIQRGMELAVIPVLLASVALALSYAMASALESKPSNLFCSLCLCGLLLSSNLETGLSFMQALASAISFQGESDKVREDAARRMSDLGRGCGMLHLMVICFLEVVLFEDTVRRITGLELFEIELVEVEIFVGAVLGCISVFVFASRVISSGYSWTMYNYKNILSQ
jgi:hypothetical protein